MKTNTHGLKMTGLKKVASESKNEGFFSRGGKLQLNYNIKTGKLWTDDLVGDSWVEYNDDDVVVITSIRNACTMQEIADIVFEKVMQKRG